MGDCFRSFYRAQVLLNSVIMANSQLRALIRSRCGRSGRRCRSISGARHSSDRIAAIVLRALVSGGGSRANYRVRGREHRASYWEVSCSFLLRPRGSFVRIRRFFFIER